MGWREQDEAQHELALKAIEWDLACRKAVEEAHGDWEGIRALFPPQLLILMVRNNLVLKYTGEPDARS